MEITKQIILDKIKIVDKLLYPSQTAICLPIITMMYKKMKNDIKFASIYVDTDLIIDGHHRYIASILSEYTLDSVPSCRTKAHETLNWEDLSFVSEEWDTSDKILRINQEDARYNNVPIENIFDMLN